MTPQPNPDNELPFGFVDIPQDGAEGSRTPVVAGWALDDSAVKLVRVYANGRYRVSTTLSVPRPDVSDVYPKYPTNGHLHGWQVEIDLGESPGPHTILVQAVDDDGATRDIGQVNVTVVSR